MSEIDYVIREDGMPLLISGESDFDLLDTEVILNNYPYILKSIIKEDYYIENELCHAFDEILFENKVVGFATYEFRENFGFLLTECYILPEFRGNRLFFNEIIKMSSTNVDFGILQPTRNIVELLIGYSFAINFTDNIVVSGIDFYFDSINAKSNKRKELSEEDLPVSNFYDLGICSTIFVHDKEVFYHDLLENDLKNHGKRKKLTKGYFSNIRKIFSRNEDEFKEMIDQLEKELPKVTWGYDDIVGDGEGLSEFMQDLVNNTPITHDKAMEIKELLKKEYESGEIDDSTIDDRFADLITADQELITSFSDFKELIENDDDENLDSIKAFIEMIGDNEELGNKLYKALLEEDEEEFHNLMINELSNDEKLLENFLDYADEYEDEFAEPMYMSNSPFQYKVWDKYRLDDTYYGKEYPISYDIDIYRVLQLLDDGLDYDFIMNFIEMEISDNNYLFTSLILQSGYVEQGINEVDWLNSGSDFTKKELQEILGFNNLKTKGNKSQLLQRLADNNVNLGETLIITQKGKDYLKEYSWVEFYMEFLSIFDFNDYCKFRDNHEGTLKNVALSYLDHHMKLASEIDDDEYFKDCIAAKKFISVAADEFISDLNIPE